MKKNRVLALIGARGGSKRLPGKNIKHLHGKPLITWSIEPVLLCKGITKLVVSTDCSEISHIAKEAGAEVPYIRSSVLASDTASTVDFALDMLDFYSERGEEFDYLLLLQPTSPLRISSDIDAIIKMAVENEGIDSFLSLCKCEHSPLWSTNLEENNEISGFLGGEALTQRSQELDTYYRLNGALYLIKTSALKEHKVFYIEGSSLGYVMPKERSVDIDDEHDFTMAEFYLSIKNKKKVSSYE